MEKIVLAADLGGTNLRMAAVNRQGNVLFRTRRSTPKADFATEIVALFVEAANECLDNVKEKGKVFAISAAVPAILNIENGIILKAPNIPLLNGFRFSKALENSLNLPCVLENDANAAAVGENWLGASKNYRNSIIVTLGTGIGGGIIIDGNILRGVDGTAGEIGHICVEPFGVLCGCGSRGCVEQYASATAIVRLTKGLEANYPKSNLQDCSKLTSKDIYEAALQDDELAIEVFRRQGFYLGIALAGLINVLNTEVIVIGGGAAAGWDLFIPQMLEQIDERAYREPSRRAKIVRAELGDDAGILGAAHLAFNKVSRF